MPATQRRSDHYAAFAFERVLKRHLRARGPPTGRVIGDARTKARSEVDRRSVSPRPGLWWVAGNWQRPDGVELKVHEEPFGGHAEEDLACVLVSCVRLVAVLRKCVRVAEMALESAFCSDA